MAAAVAIAVQQGQGNPPQLDGVGDSQALEDARRARLEVARWVRRDIEERNDETMSRAGIFGQAGRLPPEMRELYGELRRSAEARGEAETGWVNAENDALWPVEDPQAVEPLDEWLGEPTISENLTMASSSEDGGASL